MIDENQQLAIFVDGLCITEHGNKVRGTMCLTCSASEVFGRRCPSGDKSPNNASRTIVVPRPILLENFCVHKIRL